MRKLIMDRREEHFSKQWNKMVEDGWTAFSTNFDGPTYWTVFIKDERGQ